MRNCIESVLARALGWPLNGNPSRRPKARGARAVEVYLKAAAPTAVGRTREAAKTTAAASSSVLAPLRQVRNLLMSAASTKARGHRLATLQSWRGQIRAFVARAMGRPAQASPDRLGGTRCRKRKAHEVLARGDKAAAFQPCRRSDAWPRKCHYLASSSVHTASGVPVIEVEDEPSPKRCRAREGPTGGHKWVEISSQICMASGVRPVGPKLESFPAGECGRERLSVQECHSEELIPIDSFTAVPAQLFQELLQAGAAARARGQHRVAHTRGAPHSRVLIATT